MEQDAQAPRLGMIPLNVDTRTGEVTTENAGAIDANMWFVLGHYAYHQTTGDTAFLRTAWPQLQAALTWLRYQDMNGCGLLEAPEAADWADLYSTRYNTLYANALYVGTLDAAAQLAELLGEDGSYGLRLEGVGNTRNPSGASRRKTGSERGVEGSALSRFLHEIDGIRITNGSDTFQICKSYAINTVFLAPPP